MAYEVEQKFHVKDLAALREKLGSSGATVAGEVEQADTYFAHPQRDYAETDEALRLRRVGEKNFVTYKGPKLDATTKTRTEIEIPIEEGQFGRAQGEALLKALGFRQVADVIKNRQTYHMDCDGQTVEIALDTVTGLGTFVELEIGVDSQTAVAPAREMLAQLAGQLGLEHNERRSYLELLLE